MTPHSPGPVLRDYVLAEFGAARDALEHRGARLHAGVHRARKAIRRIRAVLALGADVLDREGSRLEHGLRQVNRGMSELRDAHALVETLERLLPMASDDATRRLLRRSRRAAAQRRARLGRSTRQVRKVDEACSGLKALREVAAELDWEGIRGTTLAAALMADEIRMSAVCAQALDVGADADWHRWRRRVRTHLQQQRACALAGVGAGVSRYEQSLAEQMGAMQDLSLLLSQCGHGSALSKPDRKQLRHFAEATLARQRERIASVVRMTSPC
ncbi:CHAD domain-containing protein [Lysobacter tyrosinilyticus]